MWAIENREEDLFSAYVEDTRYNKGNIFKIVSNLCQYEQLRNTSLPSQNQMNQSEKKWWDLHKPITSQSPCCPIWQGKGGKKNIASNDAPLVILTKIDLNNCKIYCNPQHGEWKTLVGLSLQHLDVWEMDGGVVHTCLWESNLLLITSSLHVSHVAGEWCFHCYHDVDSLSFFLLIVSFPLAKVDGS